MIKKNTEMKKFLVDNCILFEENVPLSQKTWIKTGGVCSYWITPCSISQLIELCRYLYSNEIKFDLVGQTSNIFFHSTYNPKVVVSTTKINNYVVDGNDIICDCGVKVVRLAKDCLTKGCAGFYGLVGLPGTVASALYNNASCFGCSISSMLVSADVLQLDGTVRTLIKEEFDFAHRSSAFKRGEKKGVILSVRLKTEMAADIEEEIRKSEGTTAYRKQKQEGPEKNLGSVFANRVQKRNIKNIIASVLTKIAGGLQVSDTCVFRKRILLRLYGYRDLDRYISDKQLNTFVWRDAEAEQMFILYKRFMNCVYKDTVIEIEEME